MKTYYYLIDDEEPTREEDIEAMNIAYKDMFIEVFNKMKTRDKLKFNSIMFPSINKSSSLFIIKGVKIKKKVFISI